MNLCQKNTGQKVVYEEKMDYILNVCKLKKRYGGMNYECKLDRA